MSGLIVRAVLVFALLGTGIYEAGALITAKAQAEDAATAAAEQGATAFLRTRDPRRAETAAAEAARGVDPSIQLTAFDVARNGTVTVTTAKVANTLFLWRLSFLREVAVQHATATGLPTR